jgi:hypothetical protein
VTYGVEHASVALVGTKVTHQKNDQRDRRGKDASGEDTNDSQTYQAHQGELQLLGGGVDRIIVGLVNGGRHGGEGRATDNSKKQTRTTMTRRGAESGGARRTEESKQ